jgi:hypothetical protein
VRDVAYSRETRNANRVLVRKPEGERVFGRYIYMQMGGQN